VNGVATKPAIVNGYAEIARRWKKGDTVELVLPMVVQRVHASDRIISTSDRADEAGAAPVRNRVALRYGPLVYNVEQVDQPITGALDPSATLTTEWRGDLLGGVTVIKSTFADGSPMMAIPNFARYNRNPPAPAFAPPTGAPQARAPRPAPQSIVWIRET
jgi:DUF1680 family protein